MKPWFDALLHPFPYIVAQQAKYVQLITRATKKLHQLIPKCSTWSVHDIFVDSYFSGYPLFVYPSIPLCIYPPRIYLSFHMQASIYLQYLHLTLSDSISLYVIPSALSLSLQNLATCTTCRSQFCTSQKIVSRAHTT